MYCSPKLLTWYAGVFDFQVILEFYVARPAVFKRRFDDGELTRLSTSTSSVKYVKNIDRTTNEPKVSLDAAADSHPTVDRSSEEQHLVGATLGFEAGIVAQFTDRAPLEKGIVC
jgi:hypothetical protein